MAGFFRGKNCIWTRRIRMVVHGLLFYSLWVDIISNGQLLYRTTCGPDYFVGITLPDQYYDIGIFNACRTETGKVPVDHPINMGSHRHQYSIQSGSLPGFSHAGCSNYSMDCLVFQKKNCLKMEQLHQGCEPWTRQLTLCSRPNHGHPVSILRDPWRGLSGIYNGNVT